MEYILLKTGAIFERINQSVVVRFIYTEVFEVLIYHYLHRVSVQEPLRSFKSTTQEFLHCRQLYSIMHSPDLIRHGLLATMNNLTTVPVVCYLVRFWFIYCIQLTSV